MKTGILNQLRNEDWIATLLGLLIVGLLILMPGIFPKLPSSFDSLGAWSSLGMLFVISMLISAVGVRFLGDGLVRFIPSFVAVFGISLLSQFISGLPTFKTLGFEAVFFSVLFGIIIRNTVGLPGWLKPAVRSEYYIKIGLVLLGTSVIFGEILKAGALGLVQGILVVFTVWYFTFWLAGKLGVDKEMSVMLSSAVSICGVSAAIATCGAIKGDSKKLTFVVSLVMVVAIPMMYIMPMLAKWMGLSQEVAGAWLGGTIDTTGAVVASGKFLGEVAETYSVIIKSSQNVLLGVAAFTISIYWSLRGKNENERPTARVLWDRFPKFVIGFMAASLIFSLCLPLSEAKELGSLAKGMREVFFSIAFVCIGLETDFRAVFRKENNKNISTFMIAQGFNIVVTLIMAVLLFGYTM